MKFLRATVNLLTIITVLSAARPATPAITATTNGFCDYFNTATLNPNWTWTDPLGDSSYSLIANSGYLRLSTPDGEHDLFINLNAPRITQSITGDFTARTRVIISPQYSYQGAGLLIWQDSDNYIRLELAGTSRSVNFISRIGGTYFDYGPDPSSGLSTVYLQLQRSGNTFTAAFSPEGANWQTFYSFSYPASASLSVGLVLINQWQDNPAWADFAFFELEQCSGDRINRRVLHIIYDPYLPSRQRYLTSYYFDPTLIAQQTIDSFRDYTQGKVNFVIQNQIRVDEFPLRSDGFRHTEDTYFHCIDNNWPDISMCDENIRVDYENLISSNDICGRLNRNEIDEVWFNPPPRTGFFESALAGPRGFWYNGSTFSDNSCQKLIPMMSSNYSREWDGGHSFGHRMEATMTYVYGSWTGNTPNPHNWEKFGMVRFESPSFNYAGCGSIHFSPNAQSASDDNDFDLTTPFDSICDDFYNYPNLGDPQVVKQPINCQAWGCTTRGYYAWWYAHIPRFNGVGADGKLNNWWIYFLDPNRALYHENVTCPDFVDPPGVDVGDIQVVADLWHIPDQYDAQYDIAPDMPNGIIDILDVMRVVARWGTCP